MKFTAKVSALRRVADAACAAAMSKSTIPILTCVHIVAREGLRLTGTDMDMEASVVCDATVTKTGDTCVDAGVLHSFVASLPAGAQIEGEMMGANLVMRSGRARCQLKTRSAADLPAPISERETAHHFTFAANELARIIERTARAVATEKARFYLNGLYLDFRPDSLACVATDGHLMSRVAAGLPEGAAGAPSVIVPRTTLTALANLLRGAEGDCSIDLSDTIIRFTIGSTTLSSKLIDGSFPNYERIIPATSGEPIRFDRAAMIEALNRLLPIIEVTKDGRKVVVKIKDETALLEGAGEHGEIADDIEISGAPPESRYCFNAANLRDGLDSIESDRVEMWLAEATMPALLHGVGEPAADIVVIGTRRD